MKALSSLPAKEKRPGVGWQCFRIDEMSWLDERPVFIVGCPRSGTTLLRKILDSHPNIFTSPAETFIFNRLNPIMCGNIYYDQYTRLPFPREDLVMWVRQFVLNLFANLARQQGKRRWAEKTPSHCLFMEFIDEVFPQCQFVHIIRNGMHVVQSLNEQPWAPRDTAENTKTWTTCVSTARRVGAALPPGRYLEIKFEHLVEHPRLMLKKLFHFLGEPCDEKAVPASLVTRNKIAKRKSLTPGERETFSRSANRLMRELGYE